jgi:hypothetical protein
LTDGESAAQDAEAASASSAAANRRSAPDEVLAIRDIEQGAGVMTPCCGGGAGPNLPITIAALEARDGSGP